MSDCGLYAQRGDQHIGLLSGEAKGELDASCKGMCQAIQLACDFLYHAVHVRGVHVGDIAIPVVVVSGGTAQFGAVYSLEHDFYPVPVLLTPPMSLYQLHQMYPVLEGIIEYVKTIPDLQCRPPSVSTATPPPSLLALDTDKYFFKPLQVFGQNLIFADGFKAKISEELVSRAKVQIPSSSISVASDSSREAKRRRTTEDNTAQHIEEEEVFIKVIDFDFAYFMDQPLPDYFLAMVTNSDNAYPEHITVANAEWSQHMLRILHRALGLEAEEGSIA
eukprot:gene16443-11757_t